MLSCDTRTLFCLLTHHKHFLAACKHFQPIIYVFSGTYSDMAGTKLAMILLVRSDLNTCLYWVKQALSREIRTEYSGIQFIVAIIEEKNKISSLKTIQLFLLINRNYFVNPTPKHLGQIMIKRCGCIGFVTRQLILQYTTQSRVMRPVN